ncbi:MAG: hypothetical protein QXW35_04650 [Candidatus Aenigmatarchaeota archaeon]
MKDDKIKYLIVINAENLLGNKKVDFYGTFRIFRRMNEVIILDKNDKDYESRRDEITKKGFAKLEFVFPRYPNDLNKINWFVYFHNPLKTILRKNYDELVNKYFNIIFLSEENLSFDTITFNYRGVPVVYECVFGKFNFMIESYEKLEEKVIVSNIGRFRNFGFGKCIINVKKFK